MGDEYISREEVLNLIDTAFESGAFDGRYAYENLIDAVQNLIHPLETDLISKQAVIDWIKTRLYQTALNNDEYITSYAKVCEDIAENRIDTWVNEVKSVEPERKPGKWKYTTHYCRKYIVCSQCGAERLHDHSTGWYYCPCCGAKMEGADG